MQNFAVLPLARTESVSPYPSDGAGIAAYQCGDECLLFCGSEPIQQFTRKTSSIVTCENHSISNGPGSAMAEVAEVMTEVCPAPVRYTGVQQRYGQAGAAPLLLQEYGLSAQHIVVVAAELCCQR